MLINSRVVILGAGGFLGQAFVNSFSKTSFVMGISGMGQSRLIVRDFQLQQTSDLPFSKSRLEQTIEEFDATLIINCSGLIGDVVCNRFPKEANWANVDLVDVLALVSNKLKVPLIHFSTDAVFGNSSVDRIETDEPRPVTVYGKTKLEGERRALEKGERCLVVRTNFYGYNPINQNGLFNFYWNSLKNAEVVKGFADVIFNPILLEDVPRVVRVLSEKRVDGIVHLVGSELISKFRFGCLVAESMKISRDRIERHYLDQSERDQSRQLMYLNSNRLSESSIEFMGIKNGVAFSNAKASGAKNEFI